MQSVCILIILCYHKNMSIQELEFHIKNKHYTYGFSKESQQNYKEYFDSVIKFFDLDSQKPRIVDNKTFKNDSGKIIYRGYDASLIKFSKYKKELLYGDYQRYHKPSNNFGAGLYFLDNTKVIKEDFYVGNFLKKLFNSTIISAKIDETKIINVYDLDELYKSKQELIVKCLIEKLINCSVQEIEEFVNFLANSNQYIFKASILGFDGIKYEMCGRNKSGNEEISTAYVVYNRKCLAIEKFFGKQFNNQQIFVNNEQNNEKSF